MVRAIRPQCLVLLALLFAVSCGADSTSPEQPIAGSTSPEQPIFESRDIVTAFNEHGLDITLVRTPADTELVALYAASTDAGDAEVALFRSAASAERASGLKDANAVAKEARADGTVWRLGNVTVAVLVDASPSVISSIDSALRSLQDAG